MKIFDKVLTQMDTANMTRLKQTIKSALVVLLCGASIALAPIAQASQTVTYYHVDLLGSPVAATDESGNLLWEENYRPYGSRMNKEAMAANNSRWFTGHPQDDNGLVYAGARYYDPIVGRFMSVDPVKFQEGNVHSFNSYAYANNNPMIYWDPDGQNPKYYNALINSLNYLQSAVRAIRTGSLFKGGRPGNPRSSSNPQKSDMPSVPRAARQAKDGPKSLKDQAADLIQKNANKNRVTSRSPSQKMEVDLAGKTHDNVPTPHTKVSPRNLKAPNQPAYNTKNSPVRPATQQDIRIVRRLLERQGR